MKYSAFAAMAALGFALSGCATIVQGTTESVSVNTTPVEGAACSLRNAEGTWYVTSPGSVTVHKTKTDLHISCKKQGYADGNMTATARFGGTTAGNILAGGLIGVAVDAASGANYYYDNPISVPMGEPTNGAATLNTAPPPPAKAPAAATTTTSDKTALSSTPSS